MKNEELPYLNLDKATSLYLPLEPIEARADYRIVFRLPDGDEEWLLARLCLIEPDVWNGCNEYRIVLRPENAEESRIFVSSSVLLRPEEFAAMNSREPAGEHEFSWDSFAKSFHHNPNDIELTRCFIVNHGHQKILAKFRIFGLGRVIGGINEADNSLQQSDCEQIGFRWRHLPPIRKKSDIDLKVALNYVDLKFLRTSNSDFIRKIHNQCKNRKSDLRYALNWINLDNDERDSIALQCKNGNWDEFAELAKRVLEVRISQLSGSPALKYKWDISNRRISVDDVRDLRHDGTLLLWRFALTNIFGTSNLHGKGLKKERSPYALSEHIRNHSKVQIIAAESSMHELMEAHLELGKWAKAHFSEENARILMNSLHGYSRAEAHKFYLSLDDNNLLDAPLKWSTVDSCCHELLIGAVQCLLRHHGFYQSEIDGISGLKTVSAVRAFQRERGLKVNGIVGPQTLPHLVVPVKRGSGGDAVRAAQALIRLELLDRRYHGSSIFSTVDGIFSAETREAVLEFQHARNRMQNLLREDGVVGPRTWCQLFK